MTLSVALIGGGAIGNLFAVELHRQGHDVTLLSRRAEVLRRVHVEGVTVQDHRSGHTASSTTARVAAMSPEDARGPYDLVMLTVKSADVQWAAELAGRIVTRSGLVCSMQNGLRGADEVECVCENGVAGTTYQGAVGDGPASVFWTASGRTLLGPRPELAAAAHELVREISRDDFQWQVAPDRDAMLWEKLIVAVSNSLSGALGLPVYDLLASTSAKRLLHAAREEAAAIASALGVRVDTSALLDRLASTGPEAIGATSGSTYQSIATGRRPEVDDISGALTELGRQYGIHTPINDMLNLMTEARCEVAGLSR